MTHIHDILNPEQLQQQLLARHVNITQHPTLPLNIYNYTQTAQYSSAWNATTKTCRGLITTTEGTIIARPFQKFFNYTEDIPPKYTHTTQPVVTEKMDGSLGIIYPIPGGYAVATRGSFSSDQALWATNWLNTTYPNYQQPDNVTTLVEIIYPQNRIVVNYGERQELVLLGATQTDTGADIPLWEIDWWSGARTAQHVCRTIEEAYRIATSHEWNKDEGLVAVWYRPNQPSYRTKIKNPEYLRLHRIITNLNKRRVWEVLASGGGFEELIEAVPDEFYGWINGTAAQLMNEHRQLKDMIYDDFVSIHDPTQSRRMFASKAADTRWPGLMFHLLDNKSIDQKVWDMVKPEAEKPFTD